MTYCGEGCREPESSGEVCLEKYCEDVCWEEACCEESCSEDETGEL